MKNIYKEIIKSLKFNLWNIDLKLIDSFLETFTGDFKLENLDYISKECNDKQFLEPEWTILAGRIQTFMIHHQMTQEYIDCKSEQPNKKRKLNDDHVENQTEKNYTSFMKNSYPEPVDFELNILNPKIISFSESTEIMKSHLLPEYYDFVMKNANVLDDYIKKYQFRDFNFDLLGISVLKKSYLSHFKINNKLEIMETPTYMYFRIAIFLYFTWEGKFNSDFNTIFEVFNSLSEGLYSQASPTMFNSGKLNHQMSSCFLIDMSDTTESITYSWKVVAEISRNCGGIGIGWEQLRHSEIGQNGITHGIIKWAKILNEIINAFDQGGKRKGSLAGYLRDIHIDIFEHIEINDVGPEDIRARDIFTAIMISDLLMRRVEEDGDWILVCPALAKKNLNGVNIMDTFGDEFEKHFLYLESNGLYQRKIKARQLFIHIMNMHLKKGMPFILFIDAINKKSNQLTYTDKTLSTLTPDSGMIHTSNLCTEIIQITNQKEISSCNLASLVLNKCVKKKLSTESSGRFEMDFEKLEYSTRSLVRNLDNVIDRNKYPESIPEILYANNLRRPIGIGVQGLADLFALLDIAWVDETGNRPSIEALTLNSHIFETMYCVALDESCNLAIERGAYPSFKGSPASFGYLQQDLWKKHLPKTSSLGQAQAHDDEFVKISNRYSLQEWSELRQKIMKHGLRHSLIISLMPTVSSAPILGNNDCFEAFPALIYAKSNLSGQFNIINKYMVRDLKKIGLWTTESHKEILHSIISSGGSLKNYNPLDLTKEQQTRLTFLKRKYLTNFEIPQTQVMARLAVDRGKWICQTQSMNCYMEKPNFDQIWKWLHFLWRNGAKTGLYYLRQQPPANPVGFALENIKGSTEKKSNKRKRPLKEVESNNKKSKISAPEECISCAS